MLKFNANSSNAISLRHLANTLSHQTKKELMNTMTEEFRSEHKELQVEIEDFCQEIEQLMKIFTVNIDTKFSNKSLDQLLDTINEQIKGYAKNSWKRILKVSEESDKTTVSYLQLYNQYNKYNLNGMSLKEMTEYSRDYRDQRLNEIYNKDVIALNEIGNILRIDHCTNKEVLAQMLKCSESILKKNKQLSIDDCYEQAKDVVYDLYFKLIRKEIISKLQKNESRDDFVLKSKKSLDTSFIKITKKYHVEMEKICKVN